MIDVCVTEHDRIQLFGIKGEVAVPLDGFAAPALEEAAFQQQSLPVNFKPVNRTGRGAGRAKELDSHSAARLALSESNTRLGQVIRGHFQVHLVSHADANEMFAHLA